MFLCFGAGAARSISISPRFPVATSTHQQQALGAAFDGTNYLVGIHGSAVHSAAVGAQLISQSGALVGPLITTGCTGSTPLAAFDGTNYLLVWVDDTIDPDLGPIYGCMISPSGTRGQPFIVSQDARAQDVASIAFDGTNYLIVWDDDGHEDADVYGQLVSTAGSRVGTEIPIGVESMDERNAEVAYDGSRYLVAWTSKRDSGPELYDIYGCFVAKSGSPSSPFLISQTPSPSQNPLAVASGTTGCLVVWNKDVGPGYPTTSDWDLYGRVISSTGGFLAPEFAVTSAPDSQMFPGLAFDGKRYLVMWTTSNLFTAPTSDEVKASVSGRFLAEQGTLEGSEFSILPVSGSLLAYPLTYGGGKFLVGFMEGDVLNGEGPCDVYGLFLDDNRSSASDTKRNPDGTRVALTDMVVTAIVTQPSNAVCVQDADRSSGIRVLPDALPPALRVGDVVTVHGDLSTTEGERVISGATITRTGSTTAPVPLGITNKSQGGSDWHYDADTGAGQRGVTGGSGLNNVGLLVRTWGNVKEFDPSTTPAWFVIDDGSGSDVRCEVPSGVAVHRTWSHVAVTGISRLDRVEGDYMRRISVRGADDVTVVKENPLDAPSFALGWHTNVTGRQWIKLVANWPAGATSMRLYQSTDKITWVPTSIPIVQTWGGQVGQALFEQWSNAYFRFTAANPNGESGPSAAIHARPFEIETGLVIDSPAPEGMTGVSLTPMLAWHPAWQQSVVLKSYYCEMDSVSPAGTVWLALTTAVPPPTSATYGQTTDMSTFRPALPLAPYALYQYVALAVDSENWAFAYSVRRFTTGP